MNHSKIVVIGGDAAGMSTASKIRRTHPEWEIVVFERGNHTSFAACGMPYYIAGDIPSPEDLIARNPEVFREKQNIDVRILHEVVDIDPESKRVHVHDMGKDQKFWESYDQLLIATGASPIRPDIEGIDAQGVFSLSVLQTGIDVFKYIEQNSPAKAIIVGGGYIGIEMAEALLARGMHVTMIDMASQVMANMDADMAEIIADYMSSKGVNLYLNEKLTRFETDKGAVKEVHTENHTFDADLVILGMGVKPNSEIAETAGIETGVAGAIRVNGRLETSQPDVWAAGDCAESLHRITNKPTWIALGTVANKHGLVAGTNMSGGDQHFPGVVGTAITKFQDLEIARTGLTEKEFKQESIPYKHTLIQSRTRSGYYPENADIHVKLFADEATGRLLGGQIVGFEGSGKRIDTIATAITAGFTAEDLMYTDLSYAPPFSPVWDPVQTAARRLSSMAGSLKS